MRTRLITLGFAFVALACTARLYYLQIMKGEEYALMADREFATPTSQLFNRGTIFFSSKDGMEWAAATTKRGVLLAIEPPKVENSEAMYASLKEVVPSLEHDSFEAKISRPGARYVVVADHLSTTTGAEIDKLDLNGVLVTRDSWRSYPAGDLAAQTIGFVGYNSADKLDGRYGLERKYETTLERAGDDLNTNFFVQLFSGLGSAIKGETRGDIITTIEPTVEAELNRELAAYAEKWQPKSAGAIIMDPQTGAIYAIAQYPTFNLNSYSSQEDPAVFTNALAQNVYEMGSIIKPLTMAAGLDSGVITSSSTYEDEGCITVNTAKVCNFDGKARGTTGMQEILSQSLNLGVSYIATKMGPDTFREYFRDRLLFGEKTGVDLPSEASGLVSNLEAPRQLEYDQASFGQGIAITPLQTVRALSTLANGGKLITPHFTKAIRNESGLTKQITWDTSKQVYSATTTEEVSRMLTKVVDEALVNGAVKMEHYSVAAKTGTAQIAQESSGGYYTDRYLHSFFGYFPSYNAKFIIFLYAVAPQGAMYSSQTWTDTFHQLTQFLINYYDIPPDR